MKKKALSILLALAMMLTMMPAMALTAFADDAAPEQAPAIEQVKEEAAPAVAPASPFDEAKAAAIKAVKEARDASDSDAVKQLANYNLGIIGNVTKPYFYNVDKDVFSKLSAEVEALKGVVDDAQVAMATVAGDDPSTAVAGVYDYFLSQIYDVDNVVLRGKTPEQRIDAYKEAGIAAIKEMQENQATATKNVNDPAFRNAKFDAPSEELAAVLGEIAEDIDEGKFFEVYGKDFRAAKHAVSKEVQNKVAKDGAEETDAVVEAQKDAWHAIAAADTYEELAAARDAAMKALEEAIAPQKVQNVVSLVASKSGKRAINLAWTPVAGADYYVVYANKCGKAYKQVAVTNSTYFKLKKIGKKKLAAHKTYKAYVVAYKDGKAVASQSVHFITAKTQGKYANAKSMNCVGSLTLNSKSAANVGASYKMDKKKKHIKASHGAAFNYASSNNYVASVDAYGNVRANHCGTAVITVREIGGLMRNVAVTVQ